jgi:predicted GIY-YIG superfamily endonuclease
MGLADGFTKKYEVHRLVYFEPYNDVEEAIRRGKAPEKMESGPEGPAHRGGKSELG